MRNGFDTQIQTVQGNYGFNIPFTLQDSEGNVVDLSGATVRFEAQLVSDDIVEFSGAVTIDSATAGTCHYNVQSTDFPISGQWNAQVIVSFTGEKLTFTGIVVTVEDQLPV